MGTTREMHEEIKILIVEDDVEMQRLYRFYLREIPRIEIAFGSQPRQVKATIEKSNPDLILLDLSLEGASVESLIQSHARRGELPLIIVITANDSVAMAVKAMQDGALNYLVKPIKKDAFLGAIGRGIDYARSLKELRHLRESERQRRDSREIIARAPAMQELLKLVKGLAPTDFTVLISGESGTGKELIARMLHANSARVRKPFVAVNCAALPDTLIESELFGYETGAFTGANQRHAGKFEQADGGTLFLDEIGDMGFSSQSRLLRVLQEGEVHRLGGTNATRVNVRVIAATNKSLQEAIKVGTFREDLYYRLSVFPVHIPPLRERKEDIVDLMYHFLESYRQFDQPRVTEFTSQAIQALASYQWPGNVRELQNVARRMLFMLEGQILDVEHLPEEIKGTVGGEADISGQIPDGFPARLVDIEKAAILRTLEQAGYQIAPAARELGISRSTLYRKMERYGISDGGKME
ncbi:MAG: sigma-54 dependent transcriptional regulator [Candidatus Marinimicrobia bacterium]|nr:sigma-54 dependent transcriptional regulator [Candidatus Neomarinimicrobiota bacterium]MCF7839524.1 sigma-54 dependent transcriptional regulator [Candidatus Neomarinimicrobiota bacterium]MCF7902453.1 sigma-54 dependent transcriptional regulator [Candidatus Neomarinimicrobiota bacterium]